MPDFHSKSKLSLEETIVYYGQLGNQNHPDAERLSIFLVSFSTNSLTPPGGALKLKQIFSVNSRKAWCRKKSLSNSTLDLRYYFLIGVLQLLLISVRRKTHWARVRDIVGTWA